MNHQKKKYIKHFFPANLQYFFTKYTFKNALDSVRLKSFIDRVKRPQKFHKLSNEKVFIIYIAKKQKNKSNVKKFKNAIPVELKKLLDRDRILKNYEKVFFFF